VSAAAAWCGCGGIAVVEHDRPDEETSPEDEGGDRGRAGMWAPGCARNVMEGQMQTASCFPRATGFECPAVYDATLYLSPTRDCAYIVSVDCGPEDMAAGWCCYVITEEDASCN
jgi:hypothetical protein